MMSPPIVSDVRLLAEHNSLRVRCRDVYSAGRLIHQPRSPALQVADRLLLIGWASLRRRHSSVRFIEG